MNLPIIIAWLKVIALMALVIGLGMLAVNQTLGYYYKSELLQQPCGLCIELNPNFTRCEITQTETIKNIYPDYDWSKINISITK